jgi:phage recombination protein Bet
MSDTALSIRTEPQKARLATRADLSWTEEQLQIIKDTFAGQKLTNQEFGVFIEYARAMRLDPLAKEVYATKRDGKLTFQTSIDAFRRKAQETGEYGGKVSEQWCGIDGVWKDVWLSDQPPAAARVAVMRHGHLGPTVAVARYKSYVQMTNDNGQSRPNFMWHKMADNQLAKCAEAKALRQAFPERFASLYIDDEMDQADNPPAPQQGGQQLQGPGDWHQRNQQQQASTPNVSSAASAPSPFNQQQVQSVPADAKPVDQAPAPAPPADPAPAQDGVVPGSDQRLALVSAVSDLAKHVASEGGAAKLTGWARDNILDPAVNNMSVVEPLALRCENEHGADCAEGTRLAAAIHKAMGPAEAAA